MTHFSRQRCVFLFLFCESSTLLSIESIWCDRDGTRPCIHPAMAVSRNHMDVIVPPCLVLILLPTCQNSTRCRICQCFFPRSYARALNFFFKETQYIHSPL